MIVDDHTKMLRFCIFILSILGISVAHKLYRTNDGTATDPRIVNGFAATLGQFPWQAAIYVKQEYSASWFCGGSIISEEWILTSANCIHGASSARILTGLVDLLSNGTESTSSNFIVHGSYNTETLKNDIGLIKLNQPLTFNGNTKTIGLTDVTLDAGTAITISGWGETSNDGPLSQNLNYVTLLTVTNTECEAFNDQRPINEEMVCALPISVINRNVCTGDLGGPATISTESGSVQVAIVSFAGDKACGNGPSGYTRIACYRDWIRQHSGI